MRMTQAYQSKEKNILSVSTPKQLTPPPGPTKEIPEVSALRWRNECDLPSLSKMLSPTDNYPQKKNQFSAMESHWVYKLY